MKKLVLLLLLLFSLTFWGCGKSESTPSAEPAPSESTPVADAADNESYAVPEALPSLTPFPEIPGATPSNVADTFTLIGFDEPLSIDEGWLYSSVEVSVGQASYMINPCKDDTTKVDWVYFSLSIDKDLSLEDETLRDAFSALGAAAILASINNAPDLTTADLDAAEAFVEENIDQVLSSAPTDDRQAIAQTTILDMPITMGHTSIAEDSTLKDYYQSDIFIQINR